MKEKLVKLLKAKKEARAALKEKSKKSTDVEELRSINSQLESIDNEITDLNSLITEAEGQPDDGQAQRTKVVNGTEQPEPRSYTPGVGFTPIAGSTPVGGEQREDVDQYATVEYRKAFMDFCKTGKQSPELRANATTTTSDVSAVIPSTILNEVIRKVTSYGQVYSRCRKLSIPGGVTVPILSLKPVATWIGESAVSDKQKVQANEKVSFSYYGLECKVATSLLADTVTLIGFENTIIDLITEAMVIAIETAIIKGDGVGKALGITVDTRVASTQIVTLSSSDIADWSAWKKKVFAKMPLAYKAGASFFMASGTFEGYIDGMVDTNGQPIGRTNFGITDGIQERFGGKDVIEVEDDIVANYDDAAVGAVVAIYCNLKNYAVNSNMQMTMFRYLDHNTNEWVDKAILMMDGKLLDPNGVVIIKKGA
jgi:HK97 family phage major capsid protein